MADFGFIPYNITGQRQTEELGADGRFNSVWIVTFTAPSGTSASVTVPVNLYTPAYVDGAIQDMLHSIETVHRLGGEPVAES
jgi:hypothetical protein